MKSILIRCDSSNIIGIGHVMRCLNLCEYYPGYQFTFVCRNFFMNITEKIRNTHELILLNYNIEPRLNDYRSWIGKEYNEELSEFISIMGKNKYDIVIIDHYGIDCLLEDQVRQYCHTVIVITDIFDFNHNCDVFINYNCDDLEKVKKINVNNDTVYRIGVKNIILNKKFTSGIQKESFNDVIKIISINMGGSDPYNYTLEVITIINEYILTNNIQVNIVIGKSNNNKNSIYNFIKDKLNYNIFIDVNYDELINLYLKGDLLIGSLSITAYERLYLNIPQICLKIVDNQLIQNLDEFNITKIDKLIVKILDYKNLHMPHTSKPKNADTNTLLSI